MNGQEPGNVSTAKTLHLNPTAFVTTAAPQIPDHELFRRVGEGAYGEVWLARNVMGTYRAVKVVYRRSFSDDRPYEREFAGIKRFEPISRAHASQVDILHVGRNDKEGYFYYVMELADDANEARSDGVMEAWSDEQGQNRQRPVTTLQHFSAPMLVEP